VSVFILTTAISLPGSGEMHLNAATAVLNPETHCENGETSRTTTEKYFGNFVSFAKTSELHIVTEIFYLMYLYGRIILKCVLLWKRIMYISDCRIS